jgi:hypothetical protein
MGPGPGAPRRLQTFPNSRPTCHGGRAGRLRGTPGRLLGHPPRHTPAPGASPLPSALLPGLGLPQLPATRSPRGAPQPRRPGAAAEPRVGPARSFLGPTGSPRWLMPQARGPPPPKLSSHLPPPPPLHAAPGRDPDPTHQRTAPLSPWAGPGRSRGLS